MILYKLGQNGMLFWEGILIGTDLSICHGLLKGTMQVEKLCYSNALDAEKELLRRFRKKRDREGYTEAQPTEVPPLPMLATVYKDHGHKLPALMYCQPKLDGIRCIGSSKGLFTRRNEIISSMPHISSALESLPPGIVLDGELYSNDLSFQEILSLVKRDVPLTKGINTIIYNVFDIINDNPFQTRFEEYKHICDMIGWPLIPVHSEPIKKSDIPEMMAKAIENGFEGIMLRDPYSPYESAKRSYGLQKHKSFSTEEYQIVDITCADRGREQGAAIFVCKTETGLKFKARPKLSLAQRCVVYRNKDSFIGYWTRITYQALTASGVPRQPIAEGLEPTREALN